MNRQIYYNPMLNFPTPTLKCILGLLKQFNGLTSLIKGRHILPRQSLWHVMPIQFQNRLNKQSSKPNKQGSYMDITCSIYLFQWANFCNHGENTVSNTQINTIFQHTSTIPYTWYQVWGIHRTETNLLYQIFRFRVLRNKKHRKCIFFTIPPDLIYLTLSLVHRSALRILNSTLMGENVLHVDFLTVELIVN